MTTATEPITRTLEVPGASLTYDLRPNERSSELPLFLIGAPMGAGGFPTLAGYFDDRTVITYDPRGSERSTAHDPAEPITPERAAEDLHACGPGKGGPAADDRRTIDDQARFRQAIQRRQGDRGVVRLVGSEEW